MGYSNELDKLYSPDNTKSQKMIKTIEEMEQKIDILEKEKKELEQKTDIVEKNKNSINNELAHAVRIIKKYHERLKIFEESKNSEFKEEPEEPENGINIFTNTKYDPNGFDMKGLHKDTENKYDPNGFDKYGKHKDTNTFFNKEKSIRKDILKNINWLNDKDEFLKLYNKIIENGEFRVHTNKDYVSSNLFKEFLENILGGNIEYNEVKNYEEEIDNIEKDLNNLIKSKKN